MKMRNNKPLILLITIAIEVTAISVLVLLFYPNFFTDIKEEEQVTEEESKEAEEEYKEVVKEESENSSNNTPEPEEGYT